ncbi:MAG: TAXI family TRAP transporter solute-binding subunit [Variovorax sp.]
MTTTEPRLERSYQLRFTGDWGSANFHKICAWLCAEFCARAGPKSRATIQSIRGGGIEAIYQVEEGEVDLCLITPAMILPQALTGEGLFEGRSAPHLRALGVLPQNDCMVLALDPKCGIDSFEALRRERPALRIAASRDDGSNFIGYVSRLMMAAHGIDEATLKSWGGSYVEDTQPSESVGRMAGGTVDAVLQEAIMTPYWADIVEAGKVIALPAEETALKRLAADHGFGRNRLPAGYWDALKAPLDALDFSDFVVVVRDDMPGDVAHLLAWCLAETSVGIERQFRHLPLKRSPVSYPFEPRKMAMPSIPLHPGARRYYEEAGHWQGTRSGQ